MRYYISGPMSGLERKVYTERFLAAERILLSEGHKVFNPARWVWFLRFLPYRFALAYDIFMLCFCDGIYMLDGWNSSEGAFTEHRFACAAGFIIRYER